MWAAITKYHKLRVLTNIYVSQFWRLRNPRSRIGSGESTLPGLQMTIFFLNPHKAEREGERGREGGREGGRRKLGAISLFCSYKGTSPIIRIPFLWPHLTLITLKGPSKYFTLGFRGFRFWGDINIQFIISAWKFALWQSKHCSNIP